MAVACKTAGRLFVRPPHHCRSSQCWGRLWGTSTHCPPQPRPCLSPMPTSSTTILAHHRHRHVCLRCPPPPRPYMYALPTPTTTMSTLPTPTTTMYVSTARNHHGCQFWWRGWGSRALWSRDTWNRYRHRHYTTTQANTTPRDGPYSPRSAPHDCGMSTRLRMAEL